MDLKAWLAHIATLHPRMIDLGLDRVRRVAERMGLASPSPFVFTIAGTNGKGSTLAALEAILSHSGLRVGCYLSPHLERFNERIRLAGVECDDDAICAALADVEHAREGDSLSYFEFATLAALGIFSRASLDALVLEVGLGGRLDAVNIVDADCALISNIELDHQDWLGSCREQIGAEKAGILRKRIPLVYGEETPPASIARRAQALEAPLYRLGREYGARQAAGAWCWWGRRQNETIRLEGLEPPRLPLPAMAAALQAAQLSALPITEAGIRAAQRQAALPGRLELRRDPAASRPVLLDVAHNPAAARLLARKIAEVRAGLETGARVAAVLAILADKDGAGILRALSAAVDVWYIAQVEDPRAMPASDLLALLRRELPGARAEAARDVKRAYRMAVDAGADLLVVTGSFHTVAAARGLTAAGARAAL